MRACLAVLLACMIFGDLFASTRVNITPQLSTDVTVPVTTNTVNIQQPYCYFENNSLCTDKTKCYVLLVSSLTSAISSYDNLTAGYIAPYNANTYNSSGNGYSTIPINRLDKIPCNGITPNNFIVGADTVCGSTTFCNAVLPAGQAMSFKYILVDQNNSLIANTDWMNVTLKSVKGPDSLGSAYAGRSGAMVVITAILSAAMALLLLFLLIAMIMICCCRKGKSQTYEARRQPSVLGSLRIPGYDVHHLKDPSPYDNPAYEYELNKKRYTTNSTLPQKTTTVITHVNAGSPDDISVQKM